MIHQPYYIFQGIALSSLSIYFYMNNFNYWAVGISALIALGSFGVSAEDPNNKKDKKIENSPKTKLTNKNITNTIKRSIIVTIGGLKVHIGMDKVKDKINKMTDNQSKDFDFRKDKEKYLLSIGFLYCLVDQVINFSNMEQEEYNQILNNLIKQFNKEIIKDKKLKKFYFASLDLNPVEFLKTGRWLSELNKEPVMEDVYATAFHMNYALVSNKKIVTDDEATRGFIKKGSKLKVGDIPMFALSYILSDKKIKLKHNLNPSILKY
jgi:hypothetical protein